ncbi:hypothetical protein NUU61_007676 [Penicillium alfredii]|uniref:Zf-CHY-domain-containing protein n=1 Tax=Penicillium alfredii TaxID=1506179 RepID=A0A9W9JY91_9EURO|nr:uncharacterized protein NUU61_007676 [Penicillium alfredii]KAJ5086369.1 hypothetical protein NUU61_007676 [Penicillium alfredii]
MSNFISSLLVDLGIRARLPRPDPPHDPDSASVQSVQPKLSPSGDAEHRTVCEHDRERGGRQELHSGDAGSLHGPPFFNTLPKDMDGRHLEPEGTPVLPIRSMPGRNDGLSGSTNSEGPRDAHGRLSPNLPNNSQDTRSDVESEGTRRNVNNVAETVDPGQFSLPADDGMGVLRRKIHAIRDLGLDNAEKARMIHDLMTESYNSSREPPLSPSLALSPTPLSPLEQPLSPKADDSPQSPNQIPTLHPLTTSASHSHTESHFSLTAEDLQPTFVPKAEPESPVGETGDEDPDTEELEEETLGCQHYKRNVKLQCYTCKRWYTCRFCHDDVEDHHLIRRDTENMLCMLCGHAQPAAQVCRQCNEQSAQYYCEICKLWDNDGKKSIYHCNDCGICRIGQGLGKDFFHCKTCCVCLPISIEITHRCIERSTQCDCPICGEYMFTSPETVVVVRCGHSIHHKCLSEYSKSSFRCPICSKTITNMESTFRNLDRTIESQPMPAEFKDTRGLIYCNDCGVKSVSYNTAQIRLLHGDTSDPLEEEGGVSSLPRPRSSSLSVNGAPMSPTLGALRTDTNSVPPSRLNVPTSAGTDSQFSSYSITRGRAISPVVSNYFGLPPERESEKPSSLPFFGSLSRADNDADSGALNFLSRKFGYGTGLLGGETESADAISEADGEDDADSCGTAGTDGSNDEEDEADEDDGDDDDAIDIFGHR